MDMYTMGPTDHAWVSGNPPEPSTTLRLPKGTTPQPGESEGGMSDEDDAEDML